MSGDIHALSGAYAVDAVDDLERAMFERHLAQCGTCRAEVDSLREAGAMLAETSAVTPPDALRNRVLAGIESVRPMPPVLLDAGDRARSTRRRFPALVAAAAALVAFGAVGASVIHPWSDDAATSEATAQLPTDLEMVDGAVADGTITIMRSKSLNQALVTAEGLPALPDDKTYELWLVHDDIMVKAGLMDGDVSHMLLEGDASTATAAGITVEPAGGSDQPTLDENAVVVPFEQA